MLLHHVGILRMSESHAETFAERMVKKTDPSQTRKVVLGQSRRASEKSSGMHSKSERVKVRRGMSKVGCDLVYSFVL